MGSPLFPGQKRKRKEKIFHLLGLFPMKQLYGAVEGAGQEEIPKAALPVLAVTSSLGVHRAPGAGASLPVGTGCGVQRCSGEVLAVRDILSDAVGEQRLERKGWGANEFRSFSVTGEQAPWARPWQKVLLCPFVHTMDLPTLLQTAFLAELVPFHSSVARGWSPLSPGTTGGGGNPPSQDPGQKILLAHLLVPAWGNGALTGPAHRNKFNPVFRSLLLNTSIVLNDVLYFIRQFT